MEIYFAILSINMEALCQLYESLEVSFSYQIAWPQLGQLQTFCDIMNSHVNFKIKANDSIFWPCISNLNGYRALDTG